MSLENDPAREWQRMQEVYAHMNDDELQTVAAEAWQLTDIAKQALAAEVKSRGADIQLQLEAPEGEEVEPEPEIENPRDFQEESKLFDPAQLNLVTVRELHDKEEARTAKWVLDTSRIPSYIGSQNCQHVDEYNGSFDKGVALKVLARDSTTALRALNEHWPKDRTDGHEPEPSGLEVRCPKCHSDEVVFESLEGGTDDSTFDTKFNWHCDACGHDWQDEGIEQEV